MDQKLQAAIDAVRSKLRIMSVKMVEGRVVIRVRAAADLARIPGQTWHKRTGWVKYPAMSYKYFDGVEFRAYLRAVPEAVNHRSVEVV